MKKLLASHKVYIGKSAIPKAGRGVFASCDIKKGEIIERCPIIEVPQNDTSLKESALVTYFFYFGRRRERAALVLGYGSIYNHSEKPNAKFKIKPDNIVIEFVAQEGIKKGEEITFNYYGSGGERGKKNPLWFKV